MHDDASAPTTLQIATFAILLLTIAMSTSAQAAALMANPGPCVGFGLNPPGVGIGECNGPGSANTLMWGSYPTESPSSSFPSVDATALVEDVRVEWTFDADEADGEATAFEVSRGLDPHLPGTWETVATLDPTVDTFVDEEGAISGDVWYVVTAELDDGSTEASEPFRVSHLQITR